MIETSDLRSLTAAASGYSEGIEGEGIIGSLLGDEEEVKENQKKWIGAARAKPFIVVVPSGKSGRIAVIHHWDMIQNSFVGVAGFAASAPIKGVATKEAFSSLVDPKLGATGSLGVPNINEFIGAMQEGVKFEEVEGNSGITVRDFAGGTCVQVFHPKHLGHAKEKKGEVTAAELATHLIRLVDEELRRSVTTEEASIIEANVQRLWIIARNLNRKTKVAEPDWSEELDDLAERVQIKAVANRKKQKESEGRKAKNQSEGSRDGDEKPDSDSETGDNTGTRNDEAYSDEEIREQRFNEAVTKARQAKLRKSNKNKNKNKNERERKTKDKRGKKHSEKEEQNATENQEQNSSHRGASTKRSSGGSSDPSSSSSESSSSETGSDADSYDSAGSNGSISVSSSSDSDENSTDESTSSGSSSLDDSQSTRQVKKRKGGKKAPKKVQKRRRKDKHGNWALVSATAHAINLYRRHEKKRERREKKKTRKEEQRKSLLKKWPRDAQKLFRLLSAKSWETPNMPSFGRVTRNLVKEGTGLTSAIETIIQTIESKGWAGTVSRSGLTEFWNRGFLAENIFEAPGGMTVFMCKPGSQPMMESLEERKQRIQSNFGDGKLLEDTLKTLATHEWFLPSNYYEAEEQLSLMVHLLDLLTSRRGIASEAYRTGLELLRGNRKAFFGAQSADGGKWFYAKFLTILDRTFQTFCRSMLERVNKREPVRGAGESLRTLQQTMVIQAIQPVLSYGDTLKVSLPRVFKAKELGKANVDVGRGGGANPKKKPGKPEEGNRVLAQWHKKNPSPVKEWLLPEGKKFGDFFNRDSKKNSIGFPKGEHHLTGAQSLICLAYQAKGECIRGSDCEYAHVPGNKFGEEDKASITKRLQEIYTK